jgi:ribulose-bisphosphate carboxylase large chain
MKKTPHLSLSGARFSVSYSLSGNKKEALAKAKDICYEQTVEFPEDLIPEGDIGKEIVGQAESFKKIGVNHYQVHISFAVETAGTELTQLLNVIFGNISLKPGIKVEKAELPAQILNLFPGPRFGQAGLRKVVQVHQRPLVCTALKPMGLGPKELAEQARLFALGGIDIIKDDHGLADQPFCPFKERIPRCAEAVRKANRQSGKSSIYMPNITAPADLLRERAVFAKKSGAGALLIIPGLTGLDSMRLLASDHNLNLPLVSHPAFLGSFVTSRQNGLSHYFLYGQLMRLAGADAVIFPHYGGRFSISREECSEIGRGCGDRMGELKPTFPVPGGGMTRKSIEDMHALYGRDFILLIGGELHRRNGDLLENSRFIVNMLEGGG